MSLSANTGNKIQSKKKLFPSEKHPDSDDEAHSLSTALYWFYPGQIV